MHIQTIALFGEAEKGTYHQLYYLKSLVQLSDSLGEPPRDSNGISLAVQCLNYEKHVIYIRVSEEGYSLKDYYIGLKMLEEDDSIPNLIGLALPGVGDDQVLKESFDLCSKKECLLLSSEKDMYDYFTNPNWA